MIVSYLLELNSNTENIKFMIIKNNIKIIMTIIIKIIIKIVYK